MMATGFRRLVQTAFFASPTGGTAKDRSNVPRPASWKRIVPSQSPLATSRPVGSKRTLPTQFGRTAGSKRGSRG